MLGAVLKSLLVMYFCPPLLVMTAETIYPRSSAIMTCTYTQAQYCQHLSSIACWSCELLFAQIKMRSARADQALADACMSDGAWFSHRSVSAICHTSVPLSVVYIMQLPLQQVALFHGTTALQQQDATSCQCTLHLRRTCSQLHRCKLL